MKRIDREKRTIETMIAVYCRHHHGDGKISRAPNPIEDEYLCKACAELKDYCHERIDRCPLGSDKKSCRKCTVHCYSPEMRGQIRQVMRYVGPRMIFLHPHMAIKHFISEL